MLLVEGIQRGNQWWRVPKSVSPLDTRNNWSWGGVGKRAQDRPESQDVHRRGRRAKGKRRWQGQGGEFASIFLKSRVVFRCQSADSGSSPFNGGENFLEGQRWRGRKPRTQWRRGSTTALWRPYPLVAALAVAGIRKDPGFLWIAERGRKARGVLVHQGTQQGSTDPRTAPHNLKLTAVHSYHNGGIIE